MSIIGTSPDFQLADFQLDVDVGDFEWSFDVCIFVANDVSWSVDKIELNVISSFINSVVKSVAKSAVKPVVKPVVKLVVKSVEKSVVESIVDCSNGKSVNENVTSW